MELLQLNAVMPLSGGQGGLSVNPITTRGADYAHHNTTALRVENLVENWVGMTKKLVQFCTQGKM